MSVYTQIVTTLTNQPPMKIDYPCSNARLVPCPLLIEGTFDAATCPGPRTVKITKPDGTVLGPFAVTYDSVDPTIWRYEWTCDATSPWVNVDVYCNGVASDGLTNVGLHNVIVQAAPAPAAAPVLTVGHVGTPGNRHLKIDINNPKEKDENDCYVLTVIRKDSHTKQTLVYREYNPSPGLCVRTIPVYFVAPGRYFVKYVYMRGVDLLEEHVHRPVVVPA